jgi:hypothetical protein
MFAALLDYKHKHGDCNVPNRYRDNSTLSAWLNTQRQCKKNGKLTPERKQRLERIGVLWNPRDAFWEEMFRALLDYRHKHGNCNVPRSWVENPKLGSSVGNQRQFKKTCRLSEGRVQRLTKIGFQWRTKAC